MYPRNFYNVRIKQQLLIDQKNSIDIFKKKKKQMVLYKSKTGLYGKDIVFKPENRISMVKGP